MLEKLFVFLKRLPSNPRLRSLRSALAAMPSGQQRMIFAGAAVLIAALVLSLLRTEDGAASESAVNVHQLLAEQQELRNELNRVQSELAQFKMPSSPAAAADAPVSPAAKAASGGAINPREYIPDGSDRDDPFLGPKDSPVLVMLFSDFQCRLCREFHLSTLPKIRSEFVDRGLIKLMYRDFPLQADAHAKRAAAFAHCAGEQGQYWKAFDVLNSNEQAVAHGDFAKLLPSLKGLDQARLATCLHSARYDFESEGDQAQAVALGAKGAPSTFVGTRTSSGTFQGVFIRGAQPFAVIEQEIQHALARVKK